MINKYAKNMFHFPELKVRTPFASVITNDKNKLTIGISKVGLKIIIQKG